ncbi:predicted protein [Naegleria gruberi]|uniref:Predicted protein n=1 Tax=Naegleria gruberi TaxID=5762 RepID=D2VFH4_NAEGR|nr:uncharacterized protein NAEGRDRAFT_58049 [Naegleria gruberi]EFC44364.1 predicted protein [Naegleria gruberi]|eukprot:XP_002677108.1 predicted protein [Naegleria gruberi strain NEG-M]
MNSLKQLKMLEKHQFINFDLKRCLNISLIKDLYSSDIVMSKFSKKYNINFNKIGKYGFSLLSLDGIDSFYSCKWGSPDVFGVTPFMHNFTKDISQTVQHIMMKDNFGNNFLHYLFSNDQNRGRSYLVTYSDIRFAKKIPKDVLLKLEQEENDTGFTPAEIGIANGWNMFQFQPLPSKIFRYKRIEMLNDKLSRPFALLDGLEVNMAILMAVGSGNKHPHLDYTIYQDINYRDVNGKHLIHYFTEYDTSKIYNATQIRSCQQILQTPDQNGTILLQTCNNWYDHLLYATTCYWKGSPTINISGYFDNLGFNRIMYGMLKFTSTTFKYLISESIVLGFDYSNENYPRLFHITFQNKDDNIHFEIDSGLIPRITGGFQWYDGEEGDEFSHFVIRLCIQQFLKDNHYAFQSVVSCLVARGLKFDVVKNSRGKTALDLLNEFKENNPSIDLGSICKQVTKGSTKKSQALVEFKIKHTKCPEEVIISQTNTSLVVKNSFLLYYHVSIKRSLYFAQKEMSTDNKGMISQ